MKRQGIAPSAENFNFCDISKKELKLIKEFIQKQVDDAQIQIHKLTGVIAGLKMSYDRVAASLDAIEKTEQQALEQ